MIQKIILLWGVMLCFYLTACTPKIQLETPKEGITINMNVVVDHKIEVSMDKQSRAIIKNVDKGKK